MTRRVVITGMGLISPLGHSPKALWENLSAGRSAIAARPAWRDKGLATTLASAAQPYEPKAIPRRYRRSMSPVATMAALAAGQAMTAAGWDEALIQHPRTGIGFASTMGGSSAIESFYETVAARRQGAIADLESTMFLKIMSHTCAAHVALTYGIPGRVVASCVACAASTQSIGFGYEAIKYGLQDRMICGGAEELHFSVAQTFEVLGATAQLSDQASSGQAQAADASRPFAKDRIGLVVGEGAGALALESLAGAKERGATILGEIKGFATTNDARHMTSPDSRGMADCMAAALIDAKVASSDVAYINAHATATDKGDAAEAAAIAELFGKEAKVSSLKGHFGHLMGASGVIETIGCLMMLRHRLWLPTRHLTAERIDPALAPIGLLTAATEQTHSQRRALLVKNSFAFGGINSSLVIGDI